MKRDEKSRMASRPPDFQATMQNTTKRDIFYLLRDIKCYIFAMIRLFFESSKSFPQIMKNFSEKPVTALPNALQWLPPRALRKYVYGYCNGEHGVPLSAWDTRSSIGKGFSMRFLVLRVESKAWPVRPCCKGELQTYL